MEAIGHCHEHKISHSDIKPENIIFDDDYNIKIIDFGLSQRFEGRGHGTFKRCGTNGYMAPEIRRSDFYNVINADLFALNVVLFITMLKLPPFKKTDSNDQFY